MAMKDGLLPEYDHEMATTRRLLERVPYAESEWRPHERSMTLGQLAGHVAFLPQWGTVTLQQTAFDLDSGDEAFRPRPPASTEALVKEFDERVASARGLLATVTDAELLTPWTLKKGNYEIFTLPRVSALRSFVMNHLIHHRGQLSVYLRMRNVPLPPIYGPTADEQ